MAVSKKFSLGVILAAATLTIMAGSIIAPVLNLMRDGLGLEPSSVGLIITTHGLFMALFSPLMGSIIDRKGARRPYIVALICYGLAGGAGLLINSFWVLLISRACLGIALAGIFTGINVLILNTYDGIERDRVMGWRGSAQSLGGVVWPLIGGTLGSFSWRYPFAVYMLAIPIGLLAIAAVLWTVSFTTIFQAPDSRIVAMAVALFGVSQGLILPTVMVWIGDVVPPSFRGRFSSYLATFGFIGQFLSPILFAPVFMLMGLNGIFLVGAGVGAVCLIMLISGFGR